MAIPAPASGSVALVTGASSGIGLELARMLAQRGHDLVLVARRRERLEQLAGELRSLGRRVETVACDVSRPESRERLLGEVEALGLTVDVLVLSAGFGMGGPFTAQDPGRVQLMLRTNFEGVVTLARAYAPAMEARRRGAILIVSSMAGNQPMPLFGAYAATKAGVTSFAEMLHEELRPSGVTVTALCPGGVETGFAVAADMVETAQRTPSCFMTDAVTVARAGIDALERGRRKAVPRAAVRALTFAGAHAPRALWLRASRRLMT